MKRPAHQVLTPDGVALSVRDSGGDAPVVVLLTGFGAPQQAWDRVIARLGPRYRTITFDYRGHGRSSAAAGYSFDGFLGDLHAVLDDASPCRPLLCGWSLGADLAVWYAADHPQAVAGMIALDGAIPAEAPASEEALRRRLDGRFHRIMKRLLRMLGGGVQLSTDEVCALTRDNQLRRDEVLDAYRRLAVPVSVALGSRPPRSPEGEGIHATWRAGAQRLAAAQPGIDIRWLDSDHAIPLRRPDEVAELITTSVAPTV